MDTKRIETIYFSYKYIFLYTALCHVKSQVWQFETELCNGSFKLM